jgi:hypothetical protein
MRSARQALHLRHAPQVHRQQHAMQQHHQQAGVHQAVDDEADVAAHRQPAQRDHRLDKSADDHQHTGHRGRAEGQPMLGGVLGVCQQGQAAVQLRGKQVEHALGPSVALARVSRGAPSASSGFAPSRRKRRSPLGAGFASAVQH